ncbi:fibronectin type III domain protein [Cooperia oncophora]
MPTEEEEEEGLFISQHPAPQSITESGQRAIFACQFNRPPHTLKWFRDDRELWAQKEKIEIETSDQESILIIHNVDERDIGHYFALLDDEHKSNAAELIYYTEPLLCYDGPSGPITAGKHFDFTVAFRGYPAPRLEMLLDDVDLRVVADVETYDDFVSVRVKNVKKTCHVRFIARNEHGERSLDIPIEVFDVPSEPLNVTASDISSTNATISWTAPTFTNGAPIIEYCVERKSLEFSRWRTVGHVPAERCSFIASDLLPNEFYAFRVSAVNSIGQGKPSKAVDVETAEETEEEFEFSLEDERATKAIEDEEQQQEEVDVLFAFLRRHFVHGKLRGLEQMLFR